MTWLGNPELNPWLASAAVFCAAVALLTIAAALLEWRAWRDGK